jgi:hypothetical protein
MRRLVPLTLSALVVLVAACGGSQSSETSPSPSHSPGDSVSVTPSSSPGPVDVPEGQPGASYSIRDAAIVFRGLAQDPGDLATSGSSMATGDFNGDGAVDLLVGAPFADGPGNSRGDAGEAYVLYGPGLNGEVVLADEAGIVIYGALAEDNLGTAVGSGDLNGDGIDDIVVAAVASNGLNNIRTDLGEVYVIFGSTDLPPAIDIGLVDQHVTVRAAEGFSRLGTSIYVGDVNMDGLDDLLLGAPFAGRGEDTPPGSQRTTEGEAYLVLGRTDLRGEVDVAEHEQDLRFKGTNQRDNFGQAVALGDVNGDGVPDAVITAPLTEAADGGREDGGSAYVFFGPLPTDGLVRAADADVVVMAAQAGDRLGGVLAVDDVNGDAIGDILIGAAEADGPGEVRRSAGELHIVFGSSALPPAIDLLAPPDDSTAVIFGPASGDGFPTAVDLWPHDSQMDLVLSAQLAAGPGGATSAGRLYLQPASDLAPAVDLRADLQEVTLIHGGELDRLGQSLSVLDIDGDGTGELAVLAPGSDGPGEAGSVYVIRFR